MPDKPGNILARIDRCTANKTTTRHEQLRRLLSRKSGASITQIQKLFDWQPHSGRAAISTLRKTGSRIDRTVTEQGSIYRIIELGDGS